MTETTVILQPTFMPWIGFFDLIDQSDIFIVLDDVQFSKQSWQQRNRIKTPKGLSYITVPVKTSGSSKQLIMDAEISGANVLEKLVRTIQVNYSRTNYFDKYYDTLADAIMSGGAGGKLVELNMSIIYWVLNCLGIRRHIYYSSQINVMGKRGDYVAALCNSVGTKKYLSPMGSREYLLQDSVQFVKSHIQILLHEYEHPIYHQNFPPFEKYATVIDLIFNTGPEAISIIRSGRRNAQVMVVE